MFDIFNQPTDGFVGLFYPGPFQHILRAHRENLLRTQAYYRSQSFAVATTHPLVQLIEHLPAPSRPLSVFEYQQRIQAHEQRLVNLFRWCTPVSLGRSRHPGLFFETNSEELIIAHAGSHSLEFLDADWTKWEPIRFLSHTQTTLALPFPNATQPLDEYGVSVILLDLPLFACQYALWYETQRDKTYARTPMQFLTNYPLNNALRSFHDVAFFNRLYNHLFDHSIEQNTGKHPFYLNQHSEQTESLYQALITRYQRTRWSFTALLNAFPGISEQTLQRVIAIPPMAMTHPLWWPLTIARLKTSSCCLQWNIARKHAPDREAVNRIRYRLKTLTNHRELDTLLSSAGKTWVYRQLAHVESLL